jgi:hypothetical protein
MIDDPLRSILAIHALVALVSCGSTCRSEAQRTVPPEVIHARACVGELGWSAPDEACVAIVEVHRRRAALTGLSPESVAVRYSAALRRPPRHRAWVRELADRSEAPRSWPSGPSWARARERFSALVNVARDALTAEPETVCPGALHYGGAMDSVPSGHEEACRWAIGRGAQMFYRRANPEGGES